MACGVSYAVSKYVGVGLNQAHRTSTIPHGGRRCAWFHSVFRYLAGGSFRRLPGRSEMPSRICLRGKLKKHQFGEYGHRAYLGKYNVNIAKMSFSILTAKLGDKLVPPILQWASAETGMS